MIEALVALALLMALAALAAALAVAPATLLMAGFWLAVAGLAFGIPTGLVYHVALHRSLRAHGRLPARWWLRPTALHGRLPEADRARVLAWCGAGALGFAVSMAGCALVAVAAWRGI